MIRVMDLFSGIGGFSLGLQRAGGFGTVAYCEIDAYCREVLAARMRDGSLDAAPICHDVRKLAGAPWSQTVDLVCGGFPCQDISLAGKGAGLDGARSGLWSEMFRVICEVRPRWVIVENVSALLDRGIGRVLGDLAGRGYDTTWRVLPACSFGAPHCRDRVWIVADANGLGREWWGKDEPSQGSGDQWPAGQFERLLQSEARVAVSAGTHRRMVDGLPNRMDRLVAAGNSVVPVIVEWIGRRIKVSA